MDSSPAAAHALRILDVLARVTGPQPAATLAREVGVPRSTTYRVLATMTELGYVVHAPGVGYALGPAAQELAWAYQRQDPLKRVAGQPLAQLADTVGHNSHLSVLLGKDVLYVIEERVKGRPWLVTDVGVRLPAELTASGLAMLSHLHAAQISALYPSKDVLVERNEKGPRTVSQLRAELTHTRSRGYAQESELITVGLGSVAVAVRDRGGHPIAAVAVTYPMRTPDGEIAELAERVRRTASTIAARLDTRRPNR